MTVLRRRVFRLKRVRFLENAGGGTVFFTSASGLRKPPTKFWRTHEVPEFDGDEACFECEQVRGEGWRIVRQVECKPWND